MKREVSKFEAFVCLYVTRCELSHLYGFSYSNKVKMLKYIIREGVNPVVLLDSYYGTCGTSSAIWYDSVNVGGTFHPRLNIHTIPIANKYCERKVK